jgi:hypothetical protein
VSIDIESITSVTGSISSVILAGTAGWKIWNDNIKKPRLELEIEKSRVVEKANGAFDFQINLTLSSSKSRFYLKEVFLLGKPTFGFLPDAPLKIILNLFPSYLHKLQLSQGIICRREAPFKVWNTNLIDFCNQPVLGRCSFDKFAENYGKDVKDIEIEDEFLTKLIFFGTVYKDKNEGRQFEIPLSNWYIYIDYGVDKITSKVFA